MPVPLRPHDSFDEVSRVLTAHAHQYLRAFAGTLFRSVIPEFQVVHGRVNLEGTRRAGRWNPPDSFSTLYGSCDEPTARAEGEKAARGIPPELQKPRKVISFETRTRLELVDMRSGDLHDHLGVLAADLLRDDWHRENDAGRESLTQAIGRAAYQLGVEGLLVPSAARGSGTNVALFTNNFILNNLFEVK